MKSAKSTLAYIVAFATVSVLVANSDAILVRLGLRAPPIEPLSTEEMREINAALERDRTPAPKLVSVYFKSNGPDAEPINDQILVFQFDRVLTEFEKTGLGRDGLNQDRWHYSYHLEGNEKMGEWNPVNTLPISSYQENAEKTRIQIELFESSLHYKPFRGSRQFESVVSESFQPGKLKRFSIRLYRWNGFFVGPRYDNLELIHEWKSQGLIEDSMGKWSVPEGVNTIPSDEAFEEFKEMNPIQPA